MPVKSICVVGLGRVGLPYAVLLARAGFQVVGVDINPDLVKEIGEGREPFQEPFLQEYLSEVINRNFRPTVDPHVMADVDAIMIFVNTNIKKRKPDLSALIKCMKTVGRNLSKGQLVIVKSTVPPGTTENVIKPLLEEESGLTAGVDFYLAYSLERGAEGCMIEDILRLPAVVGGDPKSARLAAEVLERVTGSSMIVSDATTAEAAKIFSNVYLDLNYALGNELARYCEEIGIDAWEAIAAANKGFEWKVMIRSPSPGVGGVCLTKDAYYLGTRTKVPLCFMARQINLEAPYRFVKTIEKALNSDGKGVQGSKILILGLAFKANVNDIRFSPSKVIIDKLRSKGAEVIGYDPLVTPEDAEKFMGIELVDLEEGIREADCIALVTNHDVFKNLDLAKLLPRKGDDIIVVDGWKILNQLRTEREDVAYYCVGVGRR